MSELEPICVDNKYWRWYRDIIRGAYLRGEDKVGDVRTCGRVVDYVEKHHPLPTSIVLAMGGVIHDGPPTVVICFQKHFLIHWLLSKCTRGEAYHKMLHSLGALGSTHKRKRVLKPWQYKIVTQAKSMVASSQFKTLHANPYYAEKIKTRCAAPEYRASQSAKAIEVAKRPGYKEMLSERVKKAFSTPEQKLAAAARYKLRSENPNWRRRISETKSTPEYRAAASERSKAHRGTPEARAQQSERNKLRWAKGVTEATRE